MRRSWLAALAFLGSAFGRVEDASAQSVAVKPTQVHLSDQAPTALVTLKNEGGREMRFQVSASSWEQSEKGEMKLSPTKDVVFFPTFVVLAPGAEKKVRVGTSARFEKKEKSYRMYFEELPPPETEREPGKVAVLTRLGVPVFVRTAGAEPAPALSAAARKGSLEVTLANAGNAHVIPSRVAVRLLGADGKPAQERPLESWYVLAGGKRVWDVPLSAADCKLAAGGVMVEAALGGTSLVADVDAKTLCGRE